MPLDGAGSWVPVGSTVNPAVTGTQISSTDWNTLLTDLKASLSTAMFKDGQATPTANIGMGGFRLTSLALATAVADAARVSQVQNASFTYLTGTAGTNTVTATATPTPAAYAAGQCFEFIPAATNTGATTLNVSGLGAKNLFSNGAACVGGELIISVPAFVLYDGTQFNLIGIQTGMQKLASGSVSAAATLDITANITSAFDAYRLEIYNFVPATSADDLWLRISEDSGVSFKSGANNYSYAYWLATSTPASAGGGSGAGATKIILASSALNTAVNGGVTGFVEFVLPASTTVDKSFVWELGYTTSTPALAVISGHGQYTADSGAINAIRLMFSSGNIASGSYILYGLRK